MISLSIIRFPQFFLHEIYGLPVVEMKNTIDLIEYYRLIEGKV